MKTLNNPAGIATPEQYRAALLAVRQRMTSTQLALLQAHCRSEDHAVSSNRLAELLQLPTVSAVNTAYRHYAQWLAAELKYVPDPSQGKQSWWLVLAYGRTEGAVDNDYEWIMRAELVETLQSMKWA